MLPLANRRCSARHLPALLALLLCGGPALAAQDVGRLAFEQFTLANGLEVVLAPDHASQVVGISVWYDAGSRQEPQGKAGLARLFERLMFAGSANVPGNGHAVATGDLGGRVGAAVDEELARFTTVLPSSRLAFGLWLEADRMRSLSINDTTVAEARLGLLEQYRNQLSGEPYSGAIAAAVGSLYDSTRCAGYSRSPVGNLQTITGLTTADALTFFQRHYAAGRARLVVAGDLDPVTTRTLVERYFGSIPRGDSIAEPACAPAQPAARTVRTADRNAPALAVGLFYPIPPHSHADAAGLELLEIILSQGRTARLTTQLIRGAQASLGTQGGVLGERRGPGAFGVFAIAAPNISADSLAALLAAQTAWSGGDGLTDKDLARAREIYLAGAISSRERPGDIAAVLQHAGSFHGGAGAADADVERVMAVTLSDLRRVAGAWLTPATALTLIVTPESR